MRTLLHGLLLSSLVVGSVCAQERTEDRTGLVSEQVARQTLSAHGLEAQRLVQTPRGWEAMVERDGQRMAVELDARTGVLRERGQLAPLRPQAGRAIGPQAPVVLPEPPTR
jgi:hypothetical protein